MWPKLRQRILQGRGVLITASSVAGLVIAASLTGLFQLIEWATLDQFFRLRPQEPADPRIVIVTINESDIRHLGQWPVPDAVLAKLIEKLKTQQPRAIGLDLYRDLPVEPGHQELVRVFKSTPNLIGVEKIVGDAVRPPPTLSQLGQVGIADLVLDADGKVRRGLISVKPQNSQTRLSLGVRLSLMYLETEGITLHRERGQLRLGQAVFVPFRGNDGGYVRADDGGYQILLNFRGTQENFHTVSMTDVLENRISKDLVRDRIVLIGSTAESIKDFFYTPYSSSFVTSPQRTPAVVIQANLTSQILSAALDGRPLIRVWAEPLEWLWILTWSFTGATVSRKLLQANRFRKNVYPGLPVLGILLLGGSLISGSYLAFLGGWWIPVVSPLLALTGSTILTAGYHNQGLQRLASTDGLTQVANRRFFDEYLGQEWWRSTRDKKHLSLILCDVDSFKIYNDTYGHQAGDDCLQQIVTAILDAVRSADLVARYGGEEFAVVLPDTNSENAVEVAQRIRFQVKALQIVHANSQVSQYVTVSCGVASTVADSESSPADLIAAADEALYLAKEQGRDRAILRSTSL